MSKKAKKLKANRKRRKTILESAKCEANNYRALADQYGSKVTELEAEVRKVTAQQDETSKRSIERASQIALLRDTINDLKKIIAGLERDVAERDGTVRELRWQIDQAAPKVMVKPAVFASPAEAGNRPLIASGADIAGFRDTWSRSSGEAVAPKKHWTAL